MVLDLPKIYLSIVPKDLGDTAEENEDGMENGDELSKKPLPGNAKSSGNTLPSLGETVQLLHKETVQLLHKETVSVEDKGKGKATEEIASAVDDIKKALFFGKDNEES